MLEVMSVRITELTPDHWFVSARRGTARLMQMCPTLDQALEAIKNFSAAAELPDEAYLDTIDMNEWQTIQAGIASDIFYAEEPALFYGEMQ